MSTRDPAAVLARFRPRFNVRLLSDGDARALGLPVEQLQRQVSAVDDASRLMAEEKGKRWEERRVDLEQLYSLVRALAHQAAHFRRVAVKQIWVEMPLGDGWVAAYRLLAQGGVPIVAEVRVFPREPRGLDRPGEWDAEWRSDVAVPRGGLTARLLRGVTLGAHLRYGSDALAWFRKEFGPFGVEDFTGATPPRPPGGGGRPRLPDLVYALAAEHYAKALTAGARAPVEAAAQAAGLPVADMRRRVHRARELGLLSASSPLGETSQGRAGGALTPTALKVLRKAARSTRAERQASRATNKPRRGGKR